jgi:hypothetical protein
LVWVSCCTSADRLAERAFIWPRSTSERFADHRHRLSSLSILGGEDAARNKWNFHRVKVVGADDAVDSGGRPAIHFCAAFDLKGRAAALKADRQTADRADRFNTRQGGKLRQQLIIESALLFDGRIFALGKIMRSVSSCCGSTPIST